MRQRQLLAMKGLNVAPIFLFRSSARRDRKLQHDITFSKQRIRAFTAAPDTIFSEIFNYTEQTSGVMPDSKTERVRLLFEQAHKGA